MPKRLQIGRKPLTEKQKAAIAKQKRTFVVTTPEKADEYVKYSHERNAQMQAMKNKEILRGRK